VPKGFEVLRSAQCDDDLERIFDHLFEAYCELGEDPTDSVERAAMRITAIEDALARLGDVPLQGTLEPQIMDGLRHVTKDRAIFYFVADEMREEVRVLAIFFGGQNHRDHILHRIAQTSRGSTPMPK